MQSETSKVSQPTLRKQLMICASMCALALVLIHVVQGKSIPAIVMSGRSIFLQIGFGLAVGAAAAMAALIGYKYQSKQAHGKATVASYSRLDLSGWKPIWISLGAGLGEELLFRGGLQPLLGLWLTSLVFVLAHIRAYQFKLRSMTTVIQASGIFATSVFLGAVYDYVGLVAAILVHTLIDIVGLYTIRRSAKRLRDAGPASS